MNDKQWLSELKVGDTVFMSQSYGACAVPVKVVRLTNTQVVISVNERYEIRFRKSDGWTISGDTYMRQFLRQETPELHAAYKLQGLINKAAQMRNTVNIPNTIEQVEAFIAAIQPFCVTADKGAVK